MNLIIAAVIAALSIASNAAHSADFEVGAGFAKYTTRGDMMWYQEGNPHALDMTAPAIEFGFTGNVVTRGRWGLDWHAGYAYLGNAHSDARATADHNYSKTTKSCIGQCEYLNRFVTNGHSQGLRLTLEPNYTFNGYRVGVEAGIFAYIHTFNANVWNQQDEFLGNWSSDHKVRFAPVVGASIGRGPFSVAWTHYFNKTYNDPMYAIWRGTDVVTLRYKF